MNWEHLLQKIAKAFYTEFLMDVTGILVILFYFLKAKKSGPLNYLVFLVAASLTQMVVVDYDYLKFQQSIFGRNIEQTSVYLYLVVEISCCLLFVRSYLQSGRMKKFLLTGNIIFAGAALAYWGMHLSSKIYPWYITTPEGTLIIFAALWYFYELFSNTPDKNLAQEPSFWAVSGMLIVFSAITPMFVLFNYLRKSDANLTASLYAINNASYGLLFITFIITILLDQRKSKTAFHYPNYYST